MRYQNTADGAYHHYRDYQKRVERFVFDTPYEELKEKGREVSLIYAVESMLHKQALIALRVEV